MKEIIIAAYDRDYSWIDQLDDDVKITVYRKGTNQNNPNEIYLENNVGRDVHTFFYHFAHNYDNLSDYTFTSQDYFEDHVNNYIDLINKNTKFWDYYAQQVFSECWFFSTAAPVLICDKNGNPHHSDLNIEEIWNMLFKNPCPNVIRFTPAGHFCISKNHVRRRPVGFYLHILKILEDIEISPWVIERLMPYIFDQNYETTNKYN
jgi:hypothetical protein